MGEISSSEAAELKALVERHIFSYGTSFAPYLGVRASGVDHWIAISVYAALSLYVIARLFPWHEVSAMAADPNATLADVMARMVAKNDQRAARRDGPKPP